LNGIIVGVGQNFVTICGCINTYWSVKLTYIYMISNLNKF